MSRQLSLSARPKSFDELIGQPKLIERIRRHVQSGRIPEAWLLSGPTGTGKTTVSRILSVSLECTHQELFGNPCRECKTVSKKFYESGISSGFDMYEINAAKITGIRELEEALEGTYYLPRWGSYRIYTLDECHRLSEAAQNLALKYLEDSPETTQFILCSTAPQKLIETLRSRCTVYRLRELGIDDITLLIESLLKRIKSDLPADRLADALVERGVSYPRLITQAVEKYAAGAAPEEASDVEGATEVDIKALCRSMIHGDWPGVASFLSNAQPADIRAIRLSSIAYLRSMLWASPEISGRTEVVAKAIGLLCELQNAEDLVMSAAVASALYHATAFFAEYKR
jgi:replication-associated recombination protein RarA